jgi:LGFP repeat
MGGDWHQSFQNGDLQLVQGTPVKWSSQFLINERFTQLGGSLGQAIGSIRNVNGVPDQDYTNGSIFVIGNSTITVTGSIATYYRSNISTLGLPTSEEMTTSYGKSQTFQGALITSSTQFGVHTLHGSVGGYYGGLTAAQKDQLGAATTGIGNSSSRAVRYFGKVTVLAMLNLLHLPLGLMELVSIRRSRPNLMLLSVGMF